MAIDGSTFQAVQSTARHVTEKKLQHLRKRLNAKIETSLTEVDEHDTLAASTTTPPPQGVPENMEP
jgi:hypothetical protein